MENPEQTAIKERINECMTAAYEENPGLMQFQRRKKCLLWVMILLVLANKIALIAIMGTTSIVGTAIGLLIGMGIPAIVALAVYRGPWQASFVFYALGGLLAVDVARFALPLFRIIAEGAVPGAYGGVLVVFVLETANAAVDLFLAIWLTAPKRSRELGQAARELGQDCTALIKEFEQANVAGKTRL